MPAYLIYDGDCGLCTLAQRLVRALDLRDRIEPVPLQDPRSAKLLEGVDEAMHRSTFHFVLDGKTASGGEGLLEVAGVLPMGGGIPRLAVEMPLLQWASKRVYSLLHGVRDAMRCAT